MTVVTVPGYENSGPEHWQSLWEAANPSFVRVEQADWFAPRREAWVKTLDATVAAQPGPVVLVAHSLGCATVAHWAATRPEVPVRAALLVAPADVDNAGIGELSTFAPMPLGRLPFPSIVVASSDDPWVTVERSRLFADAWGARFVDAGAHGHLNSASGIGDWPVGFELLTELLAG
jgi:predicted alpha/beta hydrolase family esterase